MKNKYYYECVDCGNKIETTEVVYLCPICEKKQDKNLPPKGVLKVLFNYSDLKTKTFKSLEKKHFIDLLPINSAKSLGFLRVGNTPMYKISKLENQKLDFSLFIKDDSQNPTFSFKDRASILVSAFAKENKIKTISAASTGNAGSSLAGICASQNQKAIIFVPATAPKAKLTQIVMYGATIIPVMGTYDDAFDLCVEFSKKFGWYNRNTAYNPLTIEGKKIVSFEIFSQLKQILPDRIFVPVGDGVIISGVYKGFEDLLKCGFISKIPIIIAVQAEGSQNLIKNINSKSFKYTPSKTIADSISVDIPRNFNMAVQFMKKYKGESIIVSDKEIINASTLLSKNTGIFAEPAAATAFAGMLKYKEMNLIQKDSKNLVLLTGSGLKDLNSVQSEITIPEPIDPKAKNLEQLIKNRLS
ncbi:MAG: threonine synthase [Bacteroidetes bacterium]|nr:threonine synthase [Bacteroidota bacterium]